MLKCFPHTPTFILEPAFVALKFFTIFIVGQKVKECQDRMQKKDQTP